MSTEKYTATGTISTISPEQTRGTYTFRTVALTIHDDKDSKYDQIVQFELGSRNMGEADKVATGDAATVSFNLRGREWTDPKSGVVKVFNTLDAWRIEAVAGANKSEPVPDHPEDIPF